jgi:IS30 family transposase
MHNTVFKNILHKMSSSVHKSPTPDKPNGENWDESNSNYIDLEHEERLAKVLSLHSKGSSQEEIAQLLGINQSTVSRDLKQIRRKARKKIEQTVSEDIPFEFERCMAGLDQVIKTLWDIAEGKNTPKTTTKDRNYALSLLMQCYSKRIELLIGGPESEMNAKKHLSDIKHQEKMDKDPLFKAMMNRY